MQEPDTQHDHQPFCCQRERESVCQEFGHNNNELTVLVPQVLAEFCDHALTLFYLNLFLFFSLPYYKLS